MFDVIATGLQGDQSMLGFLAGSGVVTTLAGIIYKLLMDRIKTLESKVEQYEEKLAQKVEDHVEAITAASAERRTVDEQAKTITRLETENRELKLKLERQ